jgi:hypothetical protein
MCPTLRGSPNNLPIEGGFILSDEKLNFHKIDLSLLLKGMALLNQNFVKY